MVPDWANTDEFDASKWWQVLDEYDVDEVARKTLFLLCQMNDEGRFEANLLMGKLLNKGYTLDSPSGFIHKCACNARKKIIEANGGYDDDERKSASWSKRHRKW